MNKKGLSTIVVTLILIVVSLVAVAIFWVVVRNLLQTGTEGIGLGRYTLSGNIKNVNLDNSTNNVSLTVERNPGQGEINGIEFIFSDGTDSEVVKETISMKELESRKFYFHLTKLNVSNLISISIAFLIKENDKETLGDIVDKYNVGEGGGTTGGGTCSPATCSGLGYECGNWGNGSCSGTLNCGTCGTGQTCNANGICQTGSCTPATCSALGHNCGSGYANGTCSGTLNCGTCPSGQSCNASGMCVGTICTPKLSCGSGECGTWANGTCSGTLNCGSCSGGQSCVGGSCILQTAWEYDWGVRTDRDGKLAGIYSQTPFPITETTTSYTITNDEGSHTYYLGTKYFVDGARPDDSGDGLTLATAKKTIGAAVTAAGNGNKIILVRAGTYDLTSPIYVGTGINDTNRWILSGYGQDRPIIRGAGLSDNALRGISKSYVTVQRLRIQDCPYMEGIYFESGNYINIVDIWLYNNTNIASAGEDGNIHLHLTNNLYLTHCTSEHTYDHCYKIGDNDNNAIVEWSIAKECAYWPGIPAVTVGTACGFDFPSDAPQEPKNAILRYNIASDVLFSAAQIRRQNNYSVHHNEFYNSPNMDAVTGERNHITNSGAVIILQTSYGDFYDNIIHSGPDGEGTADSACTDCLAVGLGLQSSSAQTSNLYNNLFYDLAQPIFVYGYTGDGIIQHYNLYSNSIYGNSNDPLVYIPNGAITTGEDTLSFKNNIIYQAGSNANSKVADFDSDVVHQYNQYYAPLSSIGITLSTGEFNTNPQWLAIPTVIFNTNFMKLTVSSPAINNGTNLGNPYNLDFDETSRPQGITWDIGAYEYH